MCYPEFSWCWIHYIYGRGKHTLPLKSQIFLERKGNIFLTLWIKLVHGHDRKSKTYRMRDRCVDTQLLVLAIDWNEAMNLMSVFVDLLIFHMFNISLLTY